MKLIITVVICILRLRVQCQTHFDQIQRYLDPFYQFSQLQNNFQQYNHPSNLQKSQQGHQQNNQESNEQQNQLLGQLQTQQSDQRYNQQYNNQQNYQQNSQQSNQQYTQLNSQQNDQQYSQQNTGSGRAIYQTTRAQNITPYLNYTTNVNNINPTASNNYLQVISKNDNQPIQFPNQQTAPTPIGEISSFTYSTQPNNAAFPSITTQPQSFDSLQQAADPNTKKDLMNAITNFGLNFMKVASQLNPGNVIVSPTSIATVLALLQQGATGEAQRQISTALNMSPDISSTVFGNIAANVTKRHSSNVLSTANSLFVSNTFNLNNNFKNLAIQKFRSSVTPLNFANPLQAIQDINGWVSANTNYKINNLLMPGSLSPATQLVLLNAVYFKGVWETKFKPERTQHDTFHLSNGQEKMVPFMNIRNSYQTGYDPKTRATVAILPFEGHQYSLILILPNENDNVNNVMSNLNTDQLLYYQTFNKNEITLQIPKFTLKTDTDLSPVLRNMGISNIFGSQSELTGIGLYSNNPPQISKAVHSGYLAIDETGVTAAAATAVVVIALSYDSSAYFTADRPFIAVLWDNQLSIPIFISRIEDPS